MKSTAFVLSIALFGSPSFASSLSAQDTVKPPEEALDDRSNFVTYDIRAALDDDAKYLRGSETITWTNRSGEAATELWFHTYLNAFSNNRSTHLIESGGMLRDTKVKDEWAGSGCVSCASTVKMSCPPSATAAPTPGLQRARAMCRAMIDPSSAWTYLER